VATTPRCDPAGAAAAAAVRLCPLSSPFTVSSGKPPPVALVIRAPPRRAPPSARNQPFSFVCLPFESMPCIAPPFLFLLPTIPFLMLVCASAPRRARLLTAPQVSAHHPFFQHARWFGDFRRNSDAKYNTPLSSRHGQRRLAAARVPQNAASTSDPPHSMVAHLRLAAHAGLEECMCLEQMRLVALDGVDWRGRRELCGAAAGLDVGCAKCQGVNLQRR